jgi:hypothetical protein
MPEHINKQETSHTSIHRHACASCRVKYLNVFDLLMTDVNGHQYASPAVHCRWQWSTCPQSFSFLVSCDRVRLSPLGTCATNWSIVPSPDGRSWVCSSRWNENWQGKPKYSEKTCPSATSSTTNPTWPDLDLNPGRHGGKPATNPPELWHGHTDVHSREEFVGFGAVTDEINTKNISSHRWSGSNYGGQVVTSFCT